MAAKRRLADRLRPIRRWAAPVESAEIRWFGRSILSTTFRTPALVLETTGRRTGLRRRTPLACHRLDDGSAGLSYAVVGGAGGQSAIPAWVANLRADPEVVVHVGRRSFPAIAREVTGLERTRLFSRLVVVWPRIRSYEHRAGRPVPVIVLDEVLDQVG